MIQPFKCGDTRALYETDKTTRFSSIQAVAERKLSQLAAAATLGFLQSPPGNRLEALSGDRAGQHGVRINDPWRVCFVWTVDGPAHVEIVDYPLMLFSMEIGMIKHGMRAVHPGEVLREDFLKPLGMSAHALSKARHVPASRVNDIVLERRDVSPDTALRLARFFGGDAQSWLNLQQMHDLKLAETEMASRIEAEIEPLAQSI